MNKPFEIEGLNFQDLVRILENTNRMMWALTAAEAVNNIDTRLGHLDNELLKLTIPLRTALGKSRECNHRWVGEDPKFSYCSNCLGFKPQEKDGV